MVRMLPLACQAIKDLMLDAWDWILGKNFKTKTWYWMPGTGDWIPGKKFKRLNLLPGNGFLIKTKDTEHEAK